MVKLQVKEKNSKLMLLWVFLAAFIPRAILCLFAEPVSIISDEVATIAGGAYWAGLDWSSVVSHAGYYGTGFTAFTAIFFKLTGNPKLLFVLITLYCSLAQSITAPIAYHILEKYFKLINRKFMFIMDEWDAVFHMPFISQKERQEYLLFLKNLLKDQVYVELAYMTGILPIAKYSAASELNMFVEYNMATRERFSSYFGFSEEEVDKLFQIYSETTIRPRITRQDLKIWYDGYCTASGEQLYNPRSIICALSDNQLGSYWTGSGPYDEIFYYIKGNIDEVREDFILMISGEHIEAKVQEYAATAEELTTKNQIYSAMVIYGLLTYEDGEVFIPNRELMYKYNELLLTNESLGYVYRLAKESERMLKATLAGDTQKSLFSSY